jgi:hypothetical protein
MLLNELQHQDHELRRQAVALTELSALRKELAELRQQVKSQETQATARTVGTVAFQR